MGPVDAKETLHRYLQLARAALLWKLDGVSEYDVRRPLTPTGTNLLGIVKHLAVVEFDYFGDTFARPHGERFAWDEREEEPNEDMFTTADETRDDIIDLYQRANAHADATIDALSLDDIGTVPWWPDDVNPVTLHWILVHMIAETNRHLGHADIVREKIDGAIGHRSGVDNLPDVDADWWTAYVERVDDAARAASGHGPTSVG
ncbi:MAG: DinB family protein [Acidimicrobiia bacterium]|nr:DinB family protein [Acidimicrobiia bacterium]